LEEPIGVAEPFPVEAVSCEIEAPAAIQQPKQPVQPVEERGDAMLFEADALHATPFDQAVVMPFD
jgi:hypothetical protein